VLVEIFKISQTNSVDNIVYISNENIKHKKDKTHSSEWILRNIWMMKKYQERMRVIHKIKNAIIKRLSVFNNDLDFVFI
jgi:hypothetical protein